MATYVWFIRHGEVDGDYVGTFVGATDVALSEVGHHQAKAVAQLLETAPLDAILTSPLQRARDTAAPLAQAKGMESTVVDGLSEMDFGAWEGLHWPQIEERDRDFAAHWQSNPTDIACPQGEAAGAFCQRVHDALHDILANHKGRHIAIFAHAGVNRAILAHALDMPYMQTFRFAQDYGCVNAAAFDPPHAQVALLNVVPGPKSDAQGDGDRIVP